MTKNNNPQHDNLQNKPTENLNESSKNNYEAEKNNHDMAKNNESDFDLSSENTDLLTYHDKVKHGDDLSLHNIKVNVSEDEVQHFLKQSSQNQQESDQTTLDDDKNQAAGVVDGDTNQSLIVQLKYSITHLWLWVVIVVDKRHSINARYHEIARVVIVIFALKMLPDFSMWVQFNTALAQSDTAIWWINTIMISSYIATAIGVSWIWDGLDALGVAEERLLKQQQQSLNSMHEINHERIDNNTDKLSQLGGQIENLRDQVKAQNQAYDKDDFDFLFNDKAEEIKKIK